MLARSPEEGVVREQTPEIGEADPGFLERSAAQPNVLQRQRDRIGDRVAKDHGQDDQSRSHEQQADGAPALLEGRT